MTIPQMGGFAPSMILRSFVKQLLPPILTQALRRITQLGKEEIVEWEYAPHGWGTQDSEIKGWNVESVARTEKSRWPAFLERVQGTGLLAQDLAAHNIIMSYAYVLSLAAQRCERISVLDWGGGMGHYFVLSKVLLPGVLLAYHCRDLPALCGCGGQALPEVTFHEDEDSCWLRSYDLVFASASLQYSENWERTLAQLASVCRRYLYVTQIPIVFQASSFVVLQRPHRYGYDTAYLGWFFNRQELIAAAHNHGMVILRELYLDAKPRVLNAPEQATYRGFLFQRR